MNEDTNALRLWALGGLGEIGMNCLALEQRGQVLLVDCGVTFDDRGIGVDVICPSFDSLEPFRDRIAGLVLTHGHEDHIGAIPYLLRRFDMPIYGPPYAIELVAGRADEHEIVDHARLHRTAPRDRFQVGSFLVEPVRVTHSIADATCLAITTDAGLVIHSGDFKFDESPPDGEAFDTERLSALGDQGVRLLLSDSTNVDSEGSAGSEASVGDALEETVRGAKGAVFVGLFASNVHRLRLLGEIARRTNRVIIPVGRSVVKHSKAAHATGYLDWDRLPVVAAERAREVPRFQWLCIVTGTQAESSAALARLARAEHPHVDVLAEDTVVLSSRIIPGHEPDVYALIALLERRGARVVTRADNRKIHVSGHAHRDDQRRLLQLVRPQTFVPLHGTLHHLSRHAELARDAGVDLALVLENGERAELTPTSLRKVGKVPTGRDHFNAGHLVTDGVIKERLSVASVGAVFVSVVMRAESTDVDVSFVGVADGPEAEGHARAARNEVRRRLEAAGHREEPFLRDEARLAARAYFFKRLGVKPRVSVHLHHG